MYEHYAGMCALTMKTDLKNLVQRGHRNEPVGACANSLVANGRRSVRRMGSLPDIMTERRRNAPTWGSTPRMAVCNVAAWPRLHHQQLKARG